MKKYSVLLFFVVLLSFFVGGFGSKVSADELKSKQITVLETPTWFQKAGFTKGIRQDKQSLGMILPANVAIEVRQTNPNFTGPLSLQFLNDDQKTEKTVNVTSNWQTISSTYVTVPFIVTPQGTTSPVLEYQVKGTSKELPTYMAGDSESEYFKGWDGSDAEFGLITSRYFQMLVPKVDKPLLKKMPDFASINNLMAYYTDVFETYNRLSGISFTPVSPTDKNIPNKYFIKANLHGVGYAYYDTMNTGQNDSSMNAYLHAGWTILHEIAHGYQGGFMERAAWDVNEVWNNTYAEYYERKYYGADYATKGTQTANGEKALREASFNQAWQVDHKDVNSWSGSDKERMLYLFMQKGGDEGFIHFNQQYRKLANTANFVQENHDLLDLLSKYYGEASGYDFTPVIESAEGKTSAALQQDTEYKDRKAVAPLKELVSASELANAQQKLNVESYLSFVDTDQMAKLQLSGNATITLDIDDFSQIEAQDLIVKNGAKVVKQVKVTSRVLNLGTLPKGIYTVYAPTGNTQKYAIDQRYLKVQQDTNTLNIKYTAKKMSTLTNPATITLLGLAEWKIGDLSADLANEKLTVKFNDFVGNFWFDESTYVKVQVLDKDGKEIYTKTRTGNSNAVVLDNVTIKEGYKIKVFHAEPDLVKFNNQKMATENTIFVVTKSGLQMESAGAHGLDWVMAKIDDAAKQIRNNPTMFASEYSTLKDDVLLAIQNLPESERAEAMVSYEDVLPKSSRQQKPVSIDVLAELHAETTETGKLSVSVLPAAADQDVSFESSNKNVVTVDASGNWKAVGKGEAVITVTSKADSHITKTITVKIAEKMDYSLTVSNYKIGDATLTGTFGKNIWKVRLWINGKVVTQATTNAAGEYTFDNASNFIHSATDLIEVVGVDTGYAEHARVKVAVTSGSESILPLTQDAYKVGDTTLTGQFGKGIWKIRLAINGKVVTQATTNPDGSYTFANASSFIKSASDKVEIIGVDTQYKEVKRITATVGGGAIDNALQAKDFTFGDTTITGTFGSAIAKVRLVVNGVTLQQATTVNGAFTFTSTNYLIKNATDKVEIVGVDAQYKEMNRIVIN